VHFEHIFVSRSKSPLKYILASFSGSIWGLGTRLLPYVLIWLVCAYMIE